MAPLRPSPPSRFVGRASDLARLDQALAGTERVVAVVGTAGVGKTRLVQEWLAARGAGPEVVAVELAGLPGRGAALARVAQELGIALGPAESEETALARTGDALASRGAPIVVLDGAETIADELAGPLEAWMRAAPQARFVVTSRRRMGGGMTHRRVDLSPLTEEEAEELLVDRVRRARRDFALSAADREPVASLLARLDGVPLAVELVAPRLRLLSPAQMLDRFHAALTAASPLDAAVARSFEMLRPHEREALAQSSVFRGGFQLDAAERVISLGPHAPPLLEVLEELVACSLLRTSTQPRLGGEVRIAHFVAVQEHAAERLAEDPVAAAAAAVRHAEAYVEAAEKWDAGIETADEAQHTQRLLLERANLEAALGRSTTDARRRARLGLVLHMAHQRGGSFGVQPDLVAGTLAAAQAAGDDRLIARSLLARARVLRWAGDHAGAARDLEQAVARFHAAGDVVGEAACERNLAAVDLGRGDHRAAGDHLERALVLGVEGGRVADEVNARNGLGWVYTLRGELERAEEQLDQARRLARRSGTPGLIALTAAALAEHSARCGRLAEAERHATEAIARFDELRYVRQLAEMLLERARLRAAEAMPGAAEDAERAVELAAGIGLRDLAARALELAAVVALGEGDTSRALELAERAAERGGETDVRTTLAACADVLMGQTSQARGRVRRIVTATAMDTATDTATRALIDAADLAAASHHCQPPSASSLSALRAVLTHRVPRTPDVPSLLLRAIHLRLARLLDDLAPPASAPELSVALDARWFHFPPRPRVDLTRRRALRGVLQALATHRRASPGIALSVDAVLSAGWPGERMTPDSGARRVYVTINRLRKMGLGDVLLTMGDGYLLDPRVELRLDGAR